MSDYPQSDNAEHDPENPAEAWRMILRKTDFHSAAITAIATAVMAFTTICYTAVSCQQWKTMDRQLTDSENAQSAQLVIEDFKGTFVVTSADQYQINSTFDVRNAGPTAANEIGFVNSSCPPPRISPFASGQSLGPGVIHPFPGPGVGGQISGLKKEGNGYFTSFCFAISYRDIFGRPHLTPDCIVYKSWKTAEKDRWIPCDPGISRQ